jgi:hypothetical protein
MPPKPGSQPNLMERQSGEMRFERLLDLPVLRVMRATVATVRALAVTLAAFASVVIFPSFLVNRVGLTKTAATVIVCVVVFSSLAAIATWFYVTTQYDPSQYSIDRLEGVLAIKPVGEHHAYEYTRRQDVRSTRGALRLIEIRSHWTGRCSRRKSRIDSIYKNHCLLDGGRPEEDGRIHRWIYPGYPVSKGNVVEVGIKQVMEDDLEPMLPYYREGGGRYRIESLTVIARFSYECEPEKVYGAVWNTNRKAQLANLVGPLAFERRPDRQAGTVDYVVFVKNPRLHHSYGLRWEW